MGLLYDSRTGRVFDDGQPEQNFNDNANTNRQGFRFSYGAGAGLGNAAARFGKAFGNIPGNLKNWFSQFNEGYKGVTNRDLWTAKGGIDGIGGLANLGGGIYHAMNSLNGISNLGSTNSDNRDLARDIKMSALSNPLATTYLDANQKRLLRQLQNGTFDNKSNRTATSDAFSGILKDSPKLLKNVLLGFVSGGTPGAIIQGLGTAANSGISAANASKEDRASELQALYDQLSNAERDYNNQRRSYYATNGNYLYY